QGQIVPGNGTATTARPVINTYCISCHNQKLKSGSLALDTVDLNNIERDSVVWERVLRKVRRNEMPPPGLPRPAKDVTAGFVTKVQEELDRLAAAHPNPGRPAVHRLNRAEYSNAIRDLLALDIQAGGSLPVDDSGYGFD